MLADRINVGHGDPVIFRDWWNRANILPSIPSQNVSLYEYQESGFDELSAATHKFHELFGTDCPSSSLVYGNGSTQVINATLYAISKRLDRQIVVGYEPPFYMLMHEYLSSCKFVELTTDLTRLDIDVEIVIDPNNPSGEHRVNKSNASYVIYDRAYNWPIYMRKSQAVTPTSSNKNHITVYTISKSLGMGGLRLGWAFINDVHLREEIQRGLFVIGICPNSFGMEIAKHVFTKFINNPAVVRDYCRKLRKLISKRRKALSNCCQFVVTNISGPYAWIKSHDGTNIAEYLLDNYNIKVYSGTEFGSTSDYARISLLCSTFDFSAATDRLTAHIRENIIRAGLMTGPGRLLSPRHQSHLNKINPLNKTV